MGKRQAVSWQEMVLIRVSTKVTGAFKDDQWKKLYDDEFKRAMIWSINMAETEVIQQAVKKGLRGVTGHLIGGIRGKLITNYKGKVGIESAASVYADIMEKGRRPGKAPPFKPINVIAVWIKRKLSVNLEDIASVAFLISRKIKTKGIKGRHFFRAAEKKVRPQIEKAFEIARNNLERKLSD